MSSYPLSSRCGRPRGIFFRFPGDFFSGYGVYIAKDGELFWILFFCVLGFFFGFCLAGRVVCLFHGASRCIPWLPFIFQSLSVFWVFSLLFTGFFGFERFCFVLAVFGRVSRDLHTCDH